MSFFFSPAKAAFFSDALRAHYDRAGTWPSDAIEVKPEVHAKFTTPPAAGLQLGSIDGQPAWVQAAPATTEQLATAARAKRDELLAGMDWRITQAFSRGQPLAPAWAAYHQALCDLPIQPAFPATITWPTPP
jgi:hypothetical protein